MPCWEFERLKNNCLEESLKAPLGRAHPRSSKLQTPSEGLERLRIWLQEPLEDPLFWLQFFRMALAPQGLLALCYAQGFAFQPPIGGLAEALGFVEESVPDKPSPSTGRVFRRTATLHWKIEWATLERGVECRQLFSEVFDSSMTEALWSWKYPEGQGLLALGDQGKIVAHYGALVRCVQVLGVPMKALQVADVMVAAKHRALMVREGAFAQLARAFQALHFESQDRFAFAYGFPTVRAMRLGARLNLYEEADRVQEIVWSGLSRRNLLGPRLRLIGNIQSIEKSLQGLWTTMAQGLKDWVLVARDPAYLVTRYDRHPGIDYICLLAQSQWSKRALGLLILRKEPEGFRLMDLVAHPSDVRSLILGLRHWIGRQGCDRLIGWSASRQLEYFIGTGFCLTGTEVAIPLNRAWCRLPVDTLKKNWWVSLGDTDFL